jgi:DNA-binding MarR family transcriptional regulator
VIEGNSLFSDNEYKIMTEIVENENVTQRQLSKSLGVSVSTVNVLMNKMIKEGLVKMTQVSQKQVLYMLTPIGIMEKTKKTMNYLKIHYRTIYETKEKIKEVLHELSCTHDVIFVLMNDDEMGEIVGIAIDEFKSIGTLIVSINENGVLNVPEFNSPVLIHMCSDEIKLEEIIGMNELSVINLIEQL